MWPMVLDYTKDECQRMLRKLELEAYAAVVSAFRAQGELTKDKKKTLQELSNILCISLERHRAEIRRAVNDERLNTIAERIVGPNTSSNWAMEGRRLVPLMPRLVPQTAFSALANSVANSLASAQAAKSAAASPTSSSVAAALEKELLQFTGNGPSAATPSCSGLNGPATSPRPLQAAAVVRPSAAWTPPTASGSMPKVPSPAVAKAEPLPIVPDVSSADEVNALRKRKRSLSLDSLPSTSDATASAIMPTSPPTTVALTTNTAAAAVPIPASAAPAPTPTAAPLARVITNSPVVTKVVVPTSLPSTSVSPSVTTKVVSLPAASTTQLRVPVVPQRTTNVPTCSQKVILVSTTAAPSSMSSGLQCPPLSVPVVKTVSAPGTAPLVHQGKAPVVMGLQASSAAHTSSPAALTSVTSVVTTPVPSASVAMTGEPGVVRLRPRAVTVNPRMPLRVPRVPAPVLPSMGGGAPQLPCPSPSYGKATISVPKGAIMQYRHEGTVKIIAQSQLPISGAKLVTKAGPGSTIATSSSSSSSTSLNVPPRVSTVSITSSQTRVVNVITASQPGVVRTLSRTVTPGTSGLSQRPNALGLRPTLGSGAKPNVIVVHKAQVWPQAQPGMASSSSHLSRSTDSVTYLQRQDRPKTTVGACGTVTVVKTSVPVPQPCVAPVVRMPRETTVKTVPRLSVPTRKVPPEQTSDSSSCGGSTLGNSGSNNNNSSLLAEVMHAAGILQGEGGSGQPPPLLVIGEDAVPPAEVEVAIDTVPVDDNAVILDDGQLLVDSEAVNVVENIPGVVVEEAPCLLQDHVVCHEVELVTQPGPQLEVVSAIPSTENSLAQLTQNGQIATKEPVSHKAFPSASSSAEQPKLKSANSDGVLPTPAPKKSSDRPRSLQGKQPGSDDGKDVPGTSNGIVASGVAERLGLMVSGATGIPISSTSKLHTTDTAPALRPATNSTAIGSTHAAPPASLAPLNEASGLLRRTDDSDLAVPGPSKVSIVGLTWKHSTKTPLPGPSSAAGQHQSNGPQQSVVRIQPDLPVGISEALSTSNGPSRVSPDADVLGSVDGNSNADMSDSQSIRQASKHSGTSSNGNGGPTQSSADNIAEDSMENSVENLIENSEGNSDDNTNDSSQGSSGMVGGETNEEDSVGPIDLQDSISSSSSAALVYPRNPDEEQSAIISSSSNDHSRRDIHKAKRACDVTSSTSVSASPCPVTPMPSTSAVFGEQSLPVASSTPSAPEQNSPDQTSEGSSTAHFELPSCFGEGNGSSSSNVTSAELEIAVVSSPTPDAQELSANSASGERNVAGSEERRSSAVESSEQEGPAEVSSAIATQQPGASLLPAQREEVTSAQNGNGPSSAANGEVTSAVSCPNFDNDDDDVDGNEAGSLVSELVVSSEEEVSTAEAVLVHSEGLAEITCSTVDATSASIASGSLFHHNARPLSVSSTEEAEYLGGSVEVDSHEIVPDAQAFNDVGTSSSCGDGGEATGAKATVGNLPPVPDEASSDSYSGVESSRTVSTACDSAPAASDHGNPNGTSDQPSQSETGGGFSAASVAEEPVESGNNGEEVYELLICDSEASEGITSVMVDSVSSTVFGAQRGAGPSPSTYHLVSLPSCSSSGPSTSCSPPAIDVASLTLAYHRTDDAANLDASSSSSLSSSSGPPIVADSSAGLPSHDGTPASNSVPGSTSSSSQPLQVDNGNASNNGSGSSSSSGTSSDPATPQNVDDSETYENGAALAASSACDVILVEAHAAGTSSEIVVYAEEEAAAGVSVSLDNCDNDCSSNAAPEDVGGNLLIVSSSASVHGHGRLANGMPDEHASTSRLALHQDEDSAASSAVSDIDAVVGNVVTVETVRDIVEQVVTSSASVTPASLSQPSTSRGAAGPQQVLKRKRRVNALIDEALCAVGHVSGWARAASGLLDRVCKFRGANRSKGVPPPAHWFLEPVDPEDAPGYYDVIDQPMDFSTIKKKLESGQYRDITEFHEDMMLVKRNCQTYNPADHEASQDCEEVFAFYLQEYNRLVEKWQKSHLISSPKRSKQS